MIEHPLSPEVLLGLGGQIPGGMMALVHPTRPYGDGGRPAREVLKDWQPRAVADLLAKTPFLLRKPLLTDGKRSLAGFDESQFRRFFTT